MAEDTHRKKGREGGGYINRKIGRRGRGNWTNKKNQSLHRRPTVGVRGKGRPNGLFHSHSDRGGKEVAYPCTVDMITGIC